MKTDRILSVVVLAVALLAFSAARRAFAAEPTDAPGLRAGPVSTNAADSETNTAAGIVFQKGDKKIVIGAELSGGAFGLPKDILEKLYPEQIVELERARRQHSQVEEVVVPLAFFATVITIVAMALGRRMRQTRLLHETIRAMIDKGQPIPPELLQPHEPKRRPKSNLRRGLVFLGIGIGLTVWLALDGRTQWALGLIPLLMGAAFLITWKVEQSKNGDRG